MKNRRLSSNPLIPTFVTCRFTIRGSCTARRSRPTLVIFTTAGMDHLSFRLVQRLVSASSADSVGAGRRGASTGAAESWSSTATLTSRAADIFSTVDHLLEDVMLCRCRPAYRQLESVAALIIAPRSRPTRALETIGVIVVQLRPALTQAPAQVPSPDHGLTLSMTLARTDSIAPRCLAERPALDGRASAVVDPPLEVVRVAAADAKDEIISSE